MQLLLQEILTNEEEKPQKEKFRLFFINIVVHLLGKCAIHFCISLQPIYFG